MSELPDKPPSDLSSLSDEANHLLAELAYCSHLLIEGKTLKGQETAINDAGRVSNADGETLYAYQCKLPSEIKPGGCWAHMRRKFTDTLKSILADVRCKNPARVGLDYCNRLFGLEFDFVKQNLDFEEKYQLRLEKSKPIARARFTWAKRENARNPIPKSFIGVALTYAVN